MEPHRKKYKGPHKILLFNDPDIETLRAAYNDLKGNSGKKSSTDILPVETKRPEDIPAVKEEKNKIITFITGEMNQISSIRDSTVKSIADQATSFIQTIIGKYSAYTEKFITDYSEKENVLLEAINHLESSADISSNPLLCRMLDFPEITNIELFDLRSTIREEMVSLEPTLEFNIEFMRFEQSNQIYEYFNANKDSIIAPIKSLFVQILEEKHFSVTNIKLNRVPLNKESVQQLCMIIPQFPSLSVLNLSENDLGVEGLKALAPVLSSCKTLRKLMICKNLLKGPGGKILGELLKQLHELISLDLSGNKFGLEGIKPICLSLQCVSKLKTLKLTNNGLGVDCTNSLASCLPALKKLRSLKLSGNSFNNDEQVIIEDHTDSKCEIKF